MLNRAMEVEAEGDQRRCAALMRWRLRDKENPLVGADTITLLACGEQASIHAPKVGTDALRLFACGEQAQHPLHRWVLAQKDSIRYRVGISFSILGALTWFGC